MALINVSSTSELKTCVPLAALPLTPNRCYHQNAMRKLKLYALMLASAVFALLAVVWGAFAFLAMVIGDCGVKSSTHLTGLSNCLSLWPCPPSRFSLPSKSVATAYATPPSLYALCGKSPSESSLTPQPSRRKFLSFSPVESIMRRIRQGF